MDDTLLDARSPRAQGAERLRVPRLALVAAVARNGVIGANNRMPWHLTGELRHFRALTTGHRIVMGRKTWASLGRPLPKRENVIVSRDASLVAPGCRVVASLADALADCALPDPIFCIGGAELYRAALPLADEIHLTEIDADFHGDTLMPAIPRDEWREIARTPASDAATGVNYAFVHYVRARLCERTQSPQIGPVHRP